MSINTTTYQNPLLSSYGNQTAYSGLNESQQTINQKLTSILGTEESDESGRTTWDVPLLDFLSDEEFAKFEQMTAGLGEQESYNAALNLQDMALNLANSMQMQSAGLTGMSSLLSGGSDDMGDLMLQNMQNSISAVYAQSNASQLQEIAAMSGETALEFSNRFFYSLNGSGMLDLSV